MLSYSQTPVQEVSHPLIKAAGVRVLVKREDLNHDYVSGNKWWKLKYNLAVAEQEGIKTLLTFGGAFSNHIYAMAAAAYELKFNSIGIIRGEPFLPLNATLQFAIDHGMEIHHLTRAQYREKSNPDFIEKLSRQFGSFFLIPEGGTNQLAIKGCAEFSETILVKIPSDYVCLSVGTGGTMAGVICGLKGERKVIGISVLKNGGFLDEEIKNCCSIFAGRSFGNWSLLTGYHQGGYAKVTPELLSFMNEMKVGNEIPLDHVYTGKLFWAIMQEIKNGAFARGSTILLIHTGGLQGARERFNR